MQLNEPPEFFCEMIDELVRLSDELNDDELKESIAWIDNESKINGVSFYKMFLIVLQRYLADEKAKKWLNEKL